MSEKTKIKIRNTGKILFLIYVALLIYFLFFSEEYGRVAEEGQGYRYNLVPFMEIRRFWLYRRELGWLALFSNVVGNIVGFIPYGYLLPVFLGNMRSGILITLSGFLISFLVETAQLATKAGCFDVDDLLLNTAGCFLGYLFFWISDRIRWRIYGKKI